jgi:hypothetical protein
MKKYAIILLLFCMNLNAQQSRTRTKIYGNKEVNNTVLYIYYTFLETSSSLKTDFFGEIIPPEHSKIYSISNYSEEVIKSLEFCLIKNYKEINAQTVILVPHLLLDRELLLNNWINEKGKTFRSPMCSHLIEFGIMEQ